MDRTDIIDLTRDDDAAAGALDEVIIVRDKRSAKKAYQKLGMKNVVVLKQHQLNVLESIDGQPGMLAVHRTGSGKTILGLATRRQLRAYWGQKTFALVIAPKKILDQYRAEVDRFGYDQGLFKFETYEGMRIQSKFEAAINFLDKHKYNVLIFDEVHRLSTNTDNVTTHKAYELAKYAKFVLCTTATPIVNDPSELSVLIGLVSGQKLLPLSKKAFDTEFETDSGLLIRNRRKFESAWLNLVSIYTQIEEEDKKFYPTFNVVIKKSLMSKLQFEYYNAVESKNIAKLGKQVVDSLFDASGNVDPKKLSKLNAFLSKTRQMCNTVKDYAPEATPLKDSSIKLWQIVNYVKNGPKPAVVFSHFLDSGIYILQRLFNEVKISFATITGTSKENPQQAVKRYNERAIDVLLISEAGAEGLDLKGTRQIHIVDQPWTDTQIQQVMGRGIRYKSHEHLPLAERHVEVVQWISVKDEAQRQKQIAEYSNRVSGGYGVWDSVWDSNSDSDSDSDSESDSTSYTDSDSDSDSSSYTDTGSDSDSDSDSDSESDLIWGGSNRLIRTRRARTLNVGGGAKKSGPKLSSVEVAEDKLARFFLRQNQIKERKKAKAEKAARRREKEARRKLREEVLMRKRAEKEVRRAMRRARKEKLLAEQKASRQRKMAKTEAKSKEDRLNKMILPSADEILRRFNKQKRLMTQKFMELLDCSSIETNFLHIRPKSASCSGADLLKRERVGITLKDVVE